MVYYLKGWWHFFLSFFNVGLVIISTFCWIQQVGLLPFIKLSGGQILKRARQYERTFYPSTESLKLIANELPLNSIGARQRAFLMMYSCEASLGVWLHLHHYKVCNYSSSRFRHWREEYELQEQVSWLGFPPGAWVTVPDICSTLNCTLVISQHWTMA